MGSWKQLADGAVTVEKEWRGALEGEAITSD